MTTLKRTIIRQGVDVRVEFTINWSIDAYQRDLSINSLSNVVFIYTTRLYHLRALTDPHSISFMREKSLDEENGSMCRTYDHLLIFVTDIASNDRLHPFVQEVMYLINHHLAGMNSIGTLFAVPF